MGYTLPPKTEEEKEAFALFEYYASKEDGPIMLMFCGLSTDDLLYEDGKDLGWILKLGDGSSLRYNKKLDLMSGIEIDNDGLKAIGTVIEE